MGKNMNISHLGNHLVFPQINHLLLMCSCSQSSLYCVNSMLLSFLLNKKPLKIKIEIVIANFKDGGLRMPDIFAYRANAGFGWMKQINADNGFK